MKSIKNKIKSNFDKAAKSYDTVANIQKICAKNLINKLITYFYRSQDNIAKILDVGTGTGYVPQILTKIYPNSCYDLNDISSNMLIMAKSKLTNLNIKYNLILGDIENLDLNAYNLIISNFALQWVIDLPKILKKLYNKSDILAFSCLVDGTFSEWSNKLKNLGSSVYADQYPKPNVLQNLLLSLNPKKHFFATKEYQLYFNNALAFIRYLKDLGAASAMNDYISVSELRNIIKTNNQPFSVTYKVFLGIVESG